MLDNDGDVPTDGSLTVVSGPSNGTVTINDGGTPNDPTDDIVTYIPNPDFNGTDTFVYEICDNASPANCSSATVTVTVTPTPDAVDDTATTDEDEPVVVDVLDNDGDVPTDGSLTVTSGPGGAAARPFVTHHNSLDIPLYMRIANELYLKRLIVGGFDGVYEFSKNFRNEGMDRTHNPEFTAMEIYVAYKDYNWMMEFTEKLLEHCAIAVNGTTEATFGEHKVDFKAPYARVTMAEAIKHFTGFDINDKTEEELFEAAKGMGIEVNKTMGKGKLIDEIFGEKCEGNYIQPTFITDYPKEMSPLCKEHRDNPELTERFELMVCGKEIANAYSELNDPIDQRERFEDQLKLSEKGDDEAMFIDQDFIRALEYGMPPTSGLGIGMDRLIMYLTNNPSIQEVLFFPQMKPERKAPTVALNDDEKAVLALLEKADKIALGDLKTQSGLSNKKWDKTIKGLTKNKLAKVEKTEEGLFVELI